LIGTHFPCSNSIAFTARNESNDFAASYIWNFPNLGLDFFGVFQGVKKHLAKNPSLPVTEDHTIRMFKACESAGASSTVRISFTHAGFIYVRGAHGGYTLSLDEAKVRGVAEFREVWDMN
jgi:hypothetical protein